MLARRVIPCLDVSDNRVVKGVQFAGLRDAGDPAQSAAAYEGQGADEIVVLDITATNRREATQLKTVQEVRDSIGLPLTVGGGVRSLEDVQRLTDAGADRVSINSAAVQQPELVSEMSVRFGRQCVVVAIDARRSDHGWEVLTHAGQRNTHRNAQEWAVEVEALGAGEILLTSFDRDGTRDGYDCELLSAVTSSVAIPVIASGGANSAAHMSQALQAGAAAVLAASIFS